LTDAPDLIAGNIVLRIVDGELVAVPLEHRVRELDAEVEALRAENTERRCEAALRVLVETLTGDDGHCADEVDFDGLEAWTRARELLKGIDIVRDR